MKTQDNSDLSEFVDGVRHIQKAIKDFDVALAAVKAAEENLAQSVGKSKTFLDEAKRLHWALLDVWNEEKLFGPTESARKRIVRDALDDCQALITRLTPPRWKDGVRIDQNHTVYKLGQA